jgi:hypothetical protein
MSYSYIATRSLVVPLEFTCKGCGFQAPVQVEATGASQQAGVAARDDAEVSRQVMGEAGVAARRWAQIFVELCPCPKCGRRDEAAAGRFKRRNWIVGGVSAGLLAVGAGLALVSLVAGIVVAALGLIAVIVTPAMALSTWGKAARQVHFPVELVPPAAIGN